ncbi:MAG: transglycosylase SLT domain-containing protein [Kofleriaceae bacterium]
MLVRGVSAIVLGLGMLAGWACPARADVYSWTDDEGVVHFTNLKPRGGKWKKVVTSSPESGSKAAAQRGSCERCDKVPATDRSPERYRRYDAFIHEASELYRIPVALIRAVIKVESDYDARVVSAMDCKGLMQVHPAVELDMGATGDIFDPRMNIMTGTRLLRYLANRLDGDLVLTIAAYHAGLGSLAKFGYTVPPYTYTRQYLKMVLDRYYQYKADEDRTRAR